MKKRIVSLLLAGLVLLSLAGCGNVFAREYSYAEKFTVNYGGAGGDATEISNYSMLKSALLNLIAQHRENAAFRFGNYNGSVVDDLAAACLEVRTSHPLGAYAVETLTYDASRIVSYYTANIDIRYKRSAEEIENIQNVISAAELETALRETLEAFHGALVLRVYSAQVDEGAIAALIETLCLQEPAAIPAAPEVAVTGYPGEGTNRIFELRLDFPHGEETMATMARQISERAASMAQEAASEAMESRPELALRLAESLAALTAEGSGGGETAYAALIDRSAGARGMALAYKALCDAAGIDCVVVKGSIGGMGAGEHYWNMISLEDSWYHADISHFNSDPVRSFLMDDAGFWGEYIWDADAYPACTGSLRYRDLVPETEVAGEAPLRPVRPSPAPVLPEETPPPEETVPPEESPPPEETVSPEETEPPEEDEAEPVGETEEEEQD